MSAKPGILLKLRFPKGKGENHFVPPLNNKNNIKKICLLQTTKVSGFQNTAVDWFSDAKAISVWKAVDYMLSERLKNGFKAIILKMLTSTAINGGVNEPKHQINKVYLCNPNSHRPTHQSFFVVHRKALEFFKISSSIRLGQNTDRFMNSIDYKPRKITTGWMTQQCMSELWISISCLLLLAWTHPKKQWPS